MRSSKLVLMALILGTSPLQGQSQKAEKAEKDRLRARQAEEAEDYFKSWLEKDVAYIITQEEREVFRALRTPDEREQFIEQFWIRRDPDPRSAANEFKLEHYRRVAFANERYQSGIPGWRTDRGKVYIIHGEPAEIEKHQPGSHYQRPSHEGGGFTVVYGFEIWRYRHIEGIGTNVEIEFVDPSGSGEYRLATNSSEKDQFLFVGTAGLTTAESLGLASRADRPYFSPWNWDRLPGTHTRAIDNPFTRYATRVAIQRPTEIKYKDLKQLVDISIQYDSLPFRTRKDYYRLNETAVLVPLTIEVDNKHLSFQEEHGMMVARVAVYGMITSITNRVIAEFEQDVEASYRPEDLEMGLQGRSVYQKVLVLENRMRYRADLVVKDLNGENIGLLRAPIAPPRRDDKLAVSSVVLTDFIGQLPDAPQKDEMFVIGDLKVLPNLRNEFDSQKPFGAYFHLYNVGMDQSTALPNLSLIYRILRDGKQVKYWSEDGGESIQFFSDQRIVVAKRLALNKLPPDDYLFEVDIEDRLTGEKVSARQRFKVEGPAAGQLASGTH